MEENQIFIKCENNDVFPTNSYEILTMNYDEDMISAQNEDGMAHLAKKEIKEELEKTISTVLEVQNNESQGPSVNNIELEVEEQQICDVETKVNILQNFAVTERKESEEVQCIENECFICYHCGDKFKTKKGVVNHFVVHKKKIHVNPTIFECEFCMFKSKYRTSLGQHLARFHMKELQEKSLGTVDTNEGSIKGNSKGNQISSFDIPKPLHVQDHSIKGEDNVYRCKLCSYSSLYEHLMKHHLVVHTVFKRKVIQCPKCPLKFTQTVLAAHMKKMHDADQIHRCPKCQYTSKWPKNISRHIKQNERKEECAPVHLRKPRRSRKEVEYDEFKKIRRQRQKMRNSVEF